MNKPIIIVGMHRSGTTLLSKILKDMGVFMGNDLSNNYESRFFQKLNINIFNQLGGRWDHPPVMEFLFNNSDNLNYILDHIIKSFKSPYLIKYLGWRLYFLEKRSSFGEKILWGWKDPRNVYTLPIWLKIFPDSKIIYIERHGVDVANSLKTRSLKKMKASKTFNEKNRIMKYYRLNMHGLSSESFRCTSLEGAFSLWEEYIQEGRNNINNLTNDNLLKIRYEDFLLRPMDHIKEISKFIELKGDTLDRIMMNIKINNDRGFAYKNNPDLVKFSETVSSRLINYAF